MEQAAGKGHRQIHDRDKFALVAIANVHSSVERELQLSDGPWVLPSAPVGLEKNWLECLGILRVRELRSANAVLIRKKACERPEVLDDEHEHLDKHLSELFYMLQLTGGLEYDGALPTDRPGSRRFLASVR